MRGGSDESENEEDEEEAGNSDDDGSFASVDELDGMSLRKPQSRSLVLITFLFAEEGKNHLLELSKLAEKDPEFFKYLQENDKELLNFDPDALAAADEDDQEEDADGDVAMEEEEKVPMLTKEQLKKWQQSLLQVRSFFHICYNLGILISFNSSNVHYVLYGSCLLLSAQRPT